ncbi:hypothetical protein [Actinoplanes sp. NBRC 103695]|uniref:hypothetical protein n=1 Tax=Actinoplanes sp. NBRC 103695 TaxID=3032202 RepID=UPI0024A5929B|nr:hypothetical protein [Actinoplanes sp. NBRC 103695]GLY98672.1 hypothetical protein Acsp02_59260 [Actinoplanes sp. NBRC 103695]
MRRVHAELLTLPSWRVTAELLKLLTLPSLLLTAVLTLTTAAVVSWADAEPVPYAQAGFLVLGVLAATDSPVATLIAMPQRLPLHAARALTLGVLALPLAAAAGDALYLTCTTLLAFGVATLVRLPLPSVLTLLGSHFIACPLLRAASTDVAPFLPDAAAGAPSRGLLTTAAWTACALTLSAWSFTRRDAP